MAQKARQFVGWIWAAYRSGTQTQAEAALAIRLEQAKRLSDFVGLLTNLSISIVFTAFFGSKAVNSSLMSLRGIEYAACSGIGFTTSLYLTVYINHIIVLFLWRDVTIFPPIWLKVVFTFSGVIAYWSLVFGIGEFAHFLANATRTALTPPDRITF